MKKPAVALHFLDIRPTPDGFSLWIQSANRERQGGSERHEGSIAELRVKGISVDVVPDSPQTINIGIGPPWLKEQFEVVGKHEDVLLLRRK